MLWLVKKIDETIGDEPVKAVKRSLSLSQILGTGYQALIRSWKTTHSRACNDGLNWTKD